MKRTPLVTALAGSILAVALVAMSGCLYVADAVHQDLRSVAKMPEAAIDGMARDFLIYRPVNTVAPVEMEKGQ